VFSTMDVNSSKLILPSLRRKRKGAASAAEPDESCFHRAPRATNPSLSASIIVLSTICCSCASCEAQEGVGQGGQLAKQERPLTEEDPQGRTLRFEPTIILSTRKSSPFEMKPSRSMSYTLNATREGGREWGGRGAPARQLRRCDCGRAPAKVWRTSR
jgi:hypothetical protein